LLLLLGAAAPLLLRLWLGDEFALHSTGLVRIFLVGILFQALNSIALGALNAQGRARIPALMHLAELPLYFTALSLAGGQFGLTGLAVVWSLRPILEYLCFTLLLQGVCVARRGTRVLGAGLAAANAIPLLFIAVDGTLPIAIVAWLAIAIVTGAWLARKAREPRTVM
jgi:O-antigen/teichoic acid export membrane protein